MFVKSSLVIGRKKRKSKKRGKKRRDKHDEGNLVHEVPEENGSQVMYGGVCMLA